MNAVLIGTIASLVNICIFTIFRRMDKSLIYGLILAVIGFLYVGYTWSDLSQAIPAFLQAVFFLLLAYFGIKRNLNYLAAGYILHGIWDLLYSQFGHPDLLPPHYDLFCLTYDFIVGFYLFYLQYKIAKPS